MRSSLMSNIIKVSKNCELSECSKNMFLAILITFVCEINLMRSLSPLVKFFLINSFFLNLEDMSPFCGATETLFWTSGDVSSGFQSQSGFCLI